VGLRVNHRFGSYEVEFLPLAPAFERLPRGSFVVTDQNVRDHWGHVIPKEFPVCTIEPGEQSKSLAVYGVVLEWLGESGADRKSTVVAFGGGVVGDLAGFVAASYMRGVQFIQIPTTLLSQVDSSVGGKVGIDLEAGKNLAGAFHAPAAVYIDVDTLSTLPERQLTNGMAEIVKMGLILDVSLADELAKGGIANLQPLVERCIRLKAAVVEEDELETTGKRAVLNFGHTIGHALEKVNGYRDVLHGEAISVGMFLEAKLGERIGVTRPGTAESVARVLKAQGLPLTCLGLHQTEELMQAMAKDKKALGGSLAFSLLEEPGRCKLVSGVSASEVKAVLNEAA
jgi:3-dehydroquinate synthase